MRRTTALLLALAVAATAGACRDPDEAEEVAVEAPDRPAPRTTTPRADQPVATPRFQAMEGADHVTGLVRLYPAGAPGARPEHEGAEVAEAAQAGFRIEVVMDGLPDGEHGWAIREGGCDRAGAVVVAMAMDGHDGIATPLRVEGDADLVLSVSGEGGAVRIETPGGHEVVLDDAEESTSVSVEDSAGNSVELDSTTGEVSISANSKITLDAPAVDISAGANLDVDSSGTASISSSGLLTMDGALVDLGSGGRPAASVGDTVADGVIRTGNPTVLL